MEKRNFVTSSRTPMEGASDIDEVLEAGAGAFGKRNCIVKQSSAIDIKSSEEDEKSDRMV
jgi:hypothetical protein